jgi:uncharacterized damage-inducible protein DinB
MYNLEQFERMRADIENMQELVKTEFSPLSEQTLNFKPDAAVWSILECLEHLNRYSLYYNEAIKKAITKVAATQAPTNYKLTWFGKMSIDLVSPSNKKKNKTIKRMNPSGGSQLTQTSIVNFLNHQTELLSLLDAASKIDANKKLVPVEFFKLIKLNIFETLMFMVEHEKRHVAQALARKKG